MVDDAAFVFDFSDAANDADGSIFFFSGDSGGVNGDQRDGDDERRKFYKTVFLRRH
jgi:hypothetical protein